METAWSHLNKLFQLSCALQADLTLGTATSHQVTDLIGQIDAATAVYAWPVDDSSRQLQAALQKFRDRVSSITTPSNWSALFKSNQEFQNDTKGVVAGLHRALIHCQAFNPYDLKPGQWCIHLVSGPVQFCRAEKRTQGRRDIIFFQFSCFDLLGNQSFVSVPADSAESRLRPLTSRENFSLDFSDISAEAVGDKRTHHSQWSEILKIGYPEQWKRLILVLVARIRQAQSGKMGAALGDPNITLLRQLLFNLSAEAALVTGESQEKILSDIYQRVGRRSDRSFFKFPRYIKAPAQEEPKVGGSVSAMVDSLRVAVAVPETMSEMVPAINPETVRKKDPDRPLTVPVDSPPPSPTLFLTHDAGEVVPQGTVEGATDHAMLRLPLSELVNGKRVADARRCHNLADYLRLFRFEEIDRDRFKNLVGVTADTVFMSWGRRRRPESPGKVILLFRYLVVFHLQASDPIPDFQQLIRFIYPELWELLISDTDMAHWNGTDPLTITVILRRQLAKMPVEHLTYENALSATGEAVPLEEGVATLARLGVKAATPRTLSQHQRGKVAPMSSQKGGTRTRETLCAMWGRSAYAFLVLRPFFAGARITAFACEVQTPALGDAMGCTVDLLPDDQEFDFLKGGRPPFDEDRYPVKYLTYSDSDPFLEVLGELSIRQSLVHSDVVFGGRRSLREIEASHANYRNLVRDYIRKPQAYPVDTPARIARFYRRFLMAARAQRQDGSWGKPLTTIMPSGDVFSFRVAAVTRRGQKPHELIWQEGIAEVPAQALVVLADVLGGRTEIAADVLRLHVAFSHYCEEGVLTRGDLGAFAKTFFSERLTASPDNTASAEACVVAYESFLEKSERTLYRPALDEGRPEITSLYRSKKTGHKSEPQATTIPALPKTPDDIPVFVDSLTSYFTNELGESDAEGRALAQVLAEYCLKNPQALERFDQPLWEEVRAPLIRNLSGQLQYDLYSAFRFLKLAGPLSFKRAQPTVFEEGDIREDRIPSGLSLPEEPDPEGWSQASRRDILVTQYLKLDGDPTATEGASEDASRVEKRRLGALLLSYFGKRFVGEVMGSSSAISESDVTSALERLQQARASLLGVESKNETSTTFQ